MSDIKRKVLNISLKIIIGIVFLLLLVILVALILISIWRPDTVVLADDNTTEKIIAFGDTRSSYVTHNNVVKMIDNESADMVIHTGDMINITTQIQSWLIFLFIEKKLWDDGTEFFATRGNHENVKWIFNSIFRVPDDKTYYTFERMGIQFIVLDASWDFEPMFDEEKQVAWLKEIITLDKDKPKIIMIHPPFETTGKYNKFYRDGWHELFLENNVIATLSAHVHSYERSDRDGIQYIVTAGGGAPMYPATYENEYSVIRRPYNHYVRITRDNSSAGSYRFEAINIDGTMFDNFTTSTKSLKK